LFVNSGICHNSGAGWALTNPGVDAARYFLLVPAGTVQVQKGLLRVGSSLIGSGKNFRNKGASAQAEGMRLPAAMLVIDPPEGLAKINTFLPESPTVLYC
jgi:hypothetical protein